MWTNVIQGIVAITLALITYFQQKSAKDSKNTREQQTIELRRKLMMMGAEVAFQAIEAAKLKQGLTGEQAFNAFLGALNAWLISGGNPEVNTDEKRELLEWSKMRSNAERYRRSMFVNGVKH